MVPVLNAKGESVSLPTGISNKFGYGIEFDDRGHYEELSIDFDAIAEHLYALHEAAKSQGIEISLVIFDRPYIPKLYAAHRGDFGRRHILFMEGEPWIRHDEHYHVDFAITCRPLSA